MKNKKTIYLVEGPCEDKLVKALKEKPELIAPGRSHVFNVIHKILPVNRLMQFDPGSRVVLIFDTDIDETTVLKKNIELLKSLDFKVEVLTIPQVLNFEEEIERSTDVKRANELTKSASISNFKSSVNRMNAAEFRNALTRHKFDITKLWARNPSKSFNFIKQDSASIKRGNH